MKNIDRNNILSGKYSVASFVGIFHEQNEWNDEEYFRLENALYESSLNCVSYPIPQELSRGVFKIFSYLMLSFSCHTDPNDGFEITNITDDQFYERRERVQLVFEGFFSGEMPDKSILGF